ncbi:hypothetical protein Cni_G16099 [Canna indica]|uniref:Uncharacterized protein n=1 Tax=Canna indica TaxID=4628 RepID=A0AAQ3KEK0_9LILI|nr:hypothetical protein Cni_G16099 [Canna indica]
MGALLGRRSLDGSAPSHKAAKTAPPPAIGRLRRPPLLPAVQSPRGDHPSLLFEVEIGVCALRNSGSITPLVLHKSSLPPTPPFEYTESDALNLVTRRCFRLPEDLFSDILVKIGSFTSLMLSGSAAELLALMGRSMKEEVAS